MEKSSMPVWGTLLMIVGGALWVLGLFMDTSIVLSGRRTINLGLQQQQMVVLISGAFLFLSGAVFFAAGRLQNSIAPVLTEQRAQLSGTANQISKSAMEAGGPTAGAEEYRGYFIVELENGEFEVRTASGEMAPGSKRYKSRQTATDFVDYIS